MEELVDGVQKELGPTVPVKTKVGLEAFRKRLRKPLIARRRKRFEQELEAFLQSERALRTAAQRYIRKKMPPIIKAAVAVMKQARALLGKDKTKKPQIRTPQSASKATK